MARKEKLISYQKIEKLIKTSRKDVAEVEILIDEKTKETITLKIKPILTVQEVAGFVTDVANGCFTETYDENGNSILEYTPFYKSFWLDKSILEYYVLNYKPDSNFERLNALANETEIIENIINVVWDVQYWTIVKDIDNLIEHKRQEILHNKKSKMDGLITTINNFIGSISERVEDIDLNEFKPFVNTFVKAQNDGSLDPERFIASYMELKEKNDTNVKEDM